MSEELKACPFCGSDNLNVFGQYRNGNHSERVQCLGCKSENDIFKWNTRHTPDAAGVVEALEAALINIDKKLDVIVSNNYDTSISSAKALLAFSSFKRSIRAELKAYKEQLGEIG